MLLTEEEAKKKVCPFWANGDWSIKCEASACMMWRWVKEAISDYIPGEKDSPKPRGYCGLASKPEF